MYVYRYTEQGGPSVLHRQEQDDPQPGRDQVKIKVQASSVNPIDIYLRRGFRPVSLPRIPHFDFAGTVLEVGSDCKRIRPGDRVWGCNTVHGDAEGTAVEMLVEKESLVFPTPDSISSIEAAALSLVSLTAYFAVHTRAQAKAGERALIYGGSGAVGHAAIELARQSGVQIISTASDAKKAEIAKEAGADTVILYKKQSVRDKVQRWTAGEGLDWILDVSLSDNLQVDLDLIRQQGRIVAVGSPVDNNPTLPWRALNQKNASLMGVLVVSMPVKEFRTAGQTLSYLMQKQILVPHIGRILPVSEIRKAHQLQEDHVITGKIVVDHTK
jgi:NADPH2:quinone reductase